MITVAILINGHLIMARSAVDTGQTAPDGRAEYHVDDGSTVLHDPGERTAALAVKLLGTIKEAK